MYVAPRRPAVAAGAALTALGARRLVSVRATAAGRPALPDQDPHQHRLRRRRHLRRPRGLPGRPPRAQARRQRRRRRGRHGRRARRDRALQRRHRRRRLLRLLRRQDGRGAHHRRPRDRADSMPRDAFIDPETGEPYDFTPELVTSGVSVGVPGHRRPPGTGAGPVGHAHFAAGARARPRGWPSAASWSTRPSATRPRTTRSGSRPTRRPRSCSCPAASPRGRVGLQEPRPGRDLPAARPQGMHAVLRAARWPPRSPSPPCRPPKSPNTDLPVPKGSMQPSAPRRLRGAQPEARRTSATAATTSTAWRRSSGRLHGGGVAQHHGAVTDLARHRPGRRPAPLPRGDRAGVRRPGGVPR